ncbi:MAG: hypothetical protein IPL21_12835 [Saprospirales bacterium]|nr:hypothetical protein [Saprospirales bacterium]
MKYLFLLLFSSSFIIMNAQDEKSPAQLKEDAAAIYKNTEITIDEQVFDYRILKHYTEAELRSLPVVKRKQIHFIYTESFTVLDIANCPSLTIKDVDAAKLESFRMQDVSYLIEYGENCKLHINLMSKNEMQQRLNAITQ